MTNVITTNLNGVYLRASYYDIVFNRDISRQVNFCLDAYERFNGHSASSVLDIACGPGYYAQGFARAGLRAVGLDLSTEMLNFGRELSAQQGLDVDFVEADMSNFKLDMPVDIVVTMFDAIDLLISDDGAINHFRSVADNLTPGGLYILEQTHPLRSNSYNIGRFNWQGERDGVDVEFVWGANFPVNDLITACADIEMEMHVNDHGNCFVIHDQTIERTRTIQELRLIAERISGDLKVVGYYGDFNLNQPLDASSGSVNMITVMQKQ